MTEATPAPRATAIVPYLAVHDAKAALAFYRMAFGAQEQLRYTGDDGRVGHAELTIGGARLFLSDEYPEIEVAGPHRRGGTTVSLHLQVTAVDGLYQRALAAGAASERPPSDQAYGHRSAVVVDPFGHRWMLDQPIEELSVAEQDERAEGFRVTGPPIEPTPGA